MIALDAEEEAKPWRLWLSVMVLVVVGAFTVYLLATDEAHATTRTCLTVVGTTVQEVCPDTPVTAYPPAPPGTPA